MPTEKWYEKDSGWIFILIALTGLIPALPYCMVGAVNSTRSFSAKRSAVIT